MVEALACSSAAAADAPPSPAADDDTAGEVGEHEGPGLKKKKKKKKSKKKKKPQDTAQDMPIVYAEVRELDTFRIEQDAVSGRCVVAARNLEAGQLVIHEPPFAK